MVVTKESDVSKFKTVLIKRVIALVAVFLIPLLVNIHTHIHNTLKISNRSFIKLITLELINSQGSVSVLSVIGVYVYVYFYVF